MISFPIAKINIGLNIIRKRPDGFHDLETVFYPVGISDGLEFAPIAGTESRFSASGIPIDADSDNNLVMKAYRLLAAEFSLPALHIHLHKHIPMGAGLGGGSSDAACMLVQLNTYFNLGLSDIQLMERAATLGSDCAFFIRNKPCLATGRGEILQPISLSLVGYTIILIKPSVFVSTKEAYAGVTPHKPDQSLEQLIQLPINKWQGCINNDFEAHIFEKHPLLAQIKSDLLGKGALYAAMSGSGSTIYGIFEQPVDHSFTINYPNATVFNLPL